MCFSYLQYNIEHNFKLYFKLSDNEGWMGAGWDGSRGAGEWHFAYFISYINSPIEDGWQKGDGLPLLRESPYQYNY